MRGEKENEREINDVETETKKPNLQLRVVPGPRRVVDAGEAAASE